MQTDDDPTPAPAEWDAAAYHRISAPQFAWGRAVLARLALRGAETILDAGCGTGRATAELLARLPAGRVVAVDRSYNMLRAAREHLRLSEEPQRRPPVMTAQADLVALPFVEAFDGIISLATFHWITNHERLFRSLYQSLVPGGWLVAQCGGAGNLAQLARRISVATACAPYAPYFAGWRQPKQYADAETTAERLRAAGFVDVETNLESAPVVFQTEDDYAEFLSVVILRAHLARLPSQSSRGAFVRVLAEQARDDDPPFALDYVRLNMRAVRGDEKEI